MKVTLLTCILGLLLLFGSCDSLDKASLPSSEPDASETLKTSPDMQDISASPPYNPTVTPLEAPLGSS